MAAVSFVDNAAAVAAGWKLTQFAIGTRFCTRYSKPIVGEGSGHTMEFIGDGASQGAADTAALTNLNAWRVNRYGSDTTTPNKGSRRHSTTLGIDLD